jgi:ComF family protein
MCRLAPPEFTRAVAYAAYDDAARELLHLLKFQGMSAVASSLLGKGMAEAIGKLLPEMARDALVIPVPLFRARARSRGFNQAQLLAEAGLAQVRIQHPDWKPELRRDLLLRVRDTRSSFAMAPHDRRANLRGAFRVAKPDELKSREVLLIDDILTTGATARECARVLKRAGAAEIWVATYARTFSEEAGPASVAMWSTPSTLSSSSRASPTN